MEVDSPNTQDFLEWFKNAGASLSDSVGIIQFPGMSRGAVALQDIAASRFCLKPCDKESQI